MHGSNVTGRPDLATAYLIVYALPNRRLEAHTWERCVTETNGGTFISLVKEYELNLATPKRYFLVSIFCKFMNFYYEL